MAASVLALAVTVSSLAALAAAQAGAGLGTLGVERGGSCGFTAAYPAAGVYMAGLSKAIYRDGAECGACYVAACVNSKQCTNGRVKFVVTNQCLGENSTSPCVWPKAGLALQPEAFDQIASSRAPGIVPMRYSRVRILVASLPPIPSPAHLFLPPPSSPPPPLPSPILPFPALA